MPFPPFFKNSRQNFLVKRNSKTIFLRKKEFKLLKYFIENQNKVITKGQLIDNIWPTGEEECTENNLDVHMSSLRNKIDKGQENKLLHTIHGIGYILSAKEENCARQDSNL